MAIDHVLQAMSWEAWNYNTTGTFNESLEDAEDFEPRLDWGGALTLRVGDAVTPGDKLVACVSEASPSGTTFSVARIAGGPDTGTYYGTAVCPDVVTPDNVLLASNAWRT
jgi:hypothetical protein